MPTRIIDTTHTLSDQALHQESQLFPSSWPITVVIVDLPAKDIPVMGNTIFLNTLTATTTLSGPQISMTDPGQKKDLIHSTQADLRDHDLIGALSTTAKELSCWEAPMTTDPLPSPASVLAKQITTQEVHNTTKPVKPHSQFAHDLLWLEPLTLCLCAVVIYWLRQRSISTT